MMSPGARGGSYGPEPAPGSFLMIRILGEILLGNTSKDKLKVSHCARRGLTTSQSSDDKNFHNLAGQLLVASKHGSAKLPVFGSCCSVHQSSAPSVPQSPTYLLPVLPAEVNLSKFTSLNDARSQLPSPSEHPWHSVCAISVPRINFTK